jgi:hypothetical protein
MKPRYKLPDFLVAGFQKCGTTALRHNLGTHKCISIAKCNNDISGEFNFFRVGSQQNTFDNGIDWYKSHFSNDGNVWGEVSPNYAFEPEKTATKISEINSNVKIIFSIRNPVDRAYSAYNHAMQLYNETNKTWSPNYDPTKSFLENIQEYNSFYLNYASVLRIYQKVLTREQILVVSQEKLNNNKESKKEYAKIGKFLGVPDGQFSNKKVHVRNKPRMLTKTEIDFMKNKYKDQNQDLFDWLGYEIKSWL